MTLQHPEDGTAQNLEHTFHHNGHDQCSDESANMPRTRWRVPGRRPTHRMLALCMRFLASWRCVCN